MIHFYKQSKYID